MVDLDNVELLRRQDPGDMAGRVDDLPAAVKLAWQKAQQLALPTEFRSVHNVVLLGMGPSAIGADLIRTLAAAESSVPITVEKGYEIPRFAGPNTLAIAVSYSGATEETLHQFREAFRRGCKLLVIASGGQLLERAHAGKASIFDFNYPCCPRAAFAYLFTPLVAFFQRLGFIEDKAEQVAEAVELMEQLRPRLAITSPTADNEAKQLAAEIFGHLPVVYAEGILSEVAHRWKTQFNENSKSWAAYEAIPELNHNALVGLEQPGSMLDRLLVLVLQSSFAHPQVAKRSQVTARILEEAGVKHRVIKPVGNSPLAQVFSAVLLGDYVSYYLAQLYGIDPSPVRVIDHLKLQLLRGQPV